jgi:hypothetical protein
MKRKLISFLFVSVVAYSAKSQVIVPSVQLSVDLSSQHFTGDEGIPSSYTKGLFGGNAGAYGTVFFTKDLKKSSFTLTTGLEYAMKGVKVDETNFKVKVHANYIQLPVFAGYNHVLPAGSVFAGVGPYIAYGVDGKIKGDGESMKTFGEDDGGFKRFDAGAAARLGFCLNNGLLFVFGYQHGLTDIAYGSHDFTAKNRSFSFAIGYSFGKRK